MRRVRRKRTRGVLSMNCVELQQSLAEGEDTRTLEQEAHLRACPACSELVGELDVIVEAASRLPGADGPSPRVWNSIEAALRKEGLIHAPGAHRPSFAARWGAARWLVPAAAMLLVVVALYERHQLLPNETSPQGSLATRATPVAHANLSGLNDDDLMQEVEDNAPTMRAEYAENLRLVNESIREAQGLVDESPNDADARRLLMDAYQQKSMLFEMAMDRQ